MKTITLIDDHTLVRKAMKTLIESFNYEVKETDSISYIYSPCDVVITDISMPGRNGYDIAKYVSECSSETRILALSMLNNDSVIAGMLDAGAHGYVCKNADASEIRTAIETVYAKGYYYNQSVIRSLKAEKKKFSDNEIQFLKYACEDLTHKEISERMYKSKKTIDSYCGELLRKLNVGNRAGLVSMAFKMGLVEP